MQLIPIIVSIIIITIVVSKKKKKSREKKQALSYKASPQLQGEALNAYFEEHIAGMIGEYVRDDSAFEEIYNEYMASAISKEKDQLLETLPALKEQYKTALKELAEIAENNTVFFTTAEEKDAFEEKVDFFEREKKMSSDIIKTLPLLANFTEIHNILEDLRKYSAEIGRLDGCFWGGLNDADYENESDELLRKLLKAYYESAMENQRKGYEYFVETLGWKRLCTGHPEFNTREYQIQFQQICQKQKFLNDWPIIWLSQFREIAKKHPRSSASFEIINFLEDANKEVGNPAWLSISGFHVYSYSSLLFFDSNKHTKTDLMELRDLYISGKMTGRYHKVNDPRYSNNEN